MIHGSYVPNMLKMDTKITSQSCPQTPDGRTDARLRDFIFCSVHMQNNTKTIMLI